MLTLLLSFFAIAQEEIWYMNGKVKKVDLAEDTVGLVVYEWMTKGGKLKTKAVRRDRVFSIVHKDGEEEIFYEQDSLIGNYFTANQQRSYLMGRQAAKGHMGMWWVTGATFALSGTAAYYEGSNFLIIVVPFGLTVASGIPRVRIKEKNLEDPSLLADPAFVLGYEDALRSGKIMKGLIGSMAGFAVGMSIHHTVGPGAD